jgi:hypothetical protein
MRLFAAGSAKTTLREAHSATLQARRQSSSDSDSLTAPAHATSAAAPVSVLVSFATVQQGSFSVPVPVIAASRCALDTD